MKKQRNTYPGILLAIAFVLLGGRAAGQIDFEGSVSYKISYSAVPAEMEGYEELLPDQTITYLKRRSSRTEVTMPKAGRQIMIYNADTQVALMLMDMLGSKTAVPFINEGAETPEESAEASRIVYFDEYKIICGYTCQRAQVKSTLLDGTVMVADIFYTEELRNNTRIFGDLKGLPLEYTTADNGVHATITATSVTAELIPETYMSLEIPEGYSLASYE